METPLIFTKYQYLFEIREVWSKPYLTNFLKNIIEQSYRFIKVYGLQRGQNFVQFHESRIAEMQELLGDIEGRNILLFSKNSAWVLS